MFSRASVWRGDFSPDQPGIALIGGAEPFALKPSDIERRVRELGRDPWNPQLTEPAAFWMYFVGDLHLEDVASNENRINREDRPWIELLGPMQHGGQRKETLCVGRRFQTWVADIKRRTQGRAPKLSAAETAGFEADDPMLEFTRLLSEGNQTGARAMQERLRRLLPEAVYKKIFP